MFKLCWGVDLKLPLALAAVLSAGFWFATSAQGFDRPYYRTDAELGQPLFAVKTYNRFSDAPGLARLDVAAEIIHDMLQFVREGDVFKASVELSLSVVSKTKGQIARQVKKLDKEVDNYPATNSRNESLVGLFSVELPPGKYTLRVTMVDRESQKRELERRDVELAAANLESGSGAGVDLSDIMLTRSSQSDREARIPDHPTVHGALPQPSSSLLCYFDIQRADPMQICRVTLSLVDKDGAVKHGDTLTLVGGSELSAYFMTVKTDDLTFGKYRIALSADAGGKTVVRSAEFRINYYGLPQSIQVIGQAVRQMKYIAGEKEIQALLNIPPPLQEKRFIAFWNEIYPPEGEVGNGKMTEYYSRIEFASLHFGNGQEGWLTDRGQVYVVFGKPSEVERHTFEEQGAPYEIWYYHHLNRRFVFRDDYGFGEYRLTTPAW